MRMIQQRNGDHDADPGGSLRRDDVTAPDSAGRAADWFEDLCHHTGGTYTGWDVAKPSGHTLN